MTGTVGVKDCVRELRSDMITKLLLLLLVFAELPLYYIPRREAKFCTNLSSMGRSPQIDKSSFETRGRYP
jgi:hypothetical protein